MSRLTTGGPTGESNTFVVACGRFENDDVLAHPLCQQRLKCNFFIMMPVSRFYVVRDIGSVPVHLEPLLVISLNEEKRWL